LKGRVGRRAWGFEKRLEQGKNNELARRCWEEIKERGIKGRKSSYWEREIEKARERRRERERKKEREVF